MIEATGHLNIPTIFVEGSGGLVRPKIYDHNRCYFLTRVPYSWLFARVYAVVHHGGSGTTHLSTGAGCATMIIPHGIDQFVWNRIVAQLGAGLLGISMGKLSLTRILPKLKVLWHQDQYRATAVALGHRMAKEDFEKELIDFVLAE